MFDAASTALKVKFDVVSDPTAVAVPLIIAVPPSAAVFVKVKPAGNEPDCNSKVTFPAESGSVAFTDKDTPVLLSSAIDPKDPAEVTNTGL